MSAAEINALAKQVGSTLTPAQRKSLEALPVSGGWATCSEMKEATGMALTLLCCRTPPLAERDWTRWGGEFGQKAGKGYQYRITRFGRAVRVRVSILGAALSGDPA